MSDPRPIGVFDSGVGGIGTLAAIRKLLPQEHFIYYGDTAHAPYGTKPREKVLVLVQDVMAYMLAQNVKAVCIACNTATSVAAADLRARYGLPIIGMEPALKPACEQRREGLNLILATPVTLKLEKFARLMSLYGEGAVPLPCAGLMELVEKEDYPAAKQYLLELLAPYDLTQVDGVVLGCTHYVFLRPLLQKILPKNVRVFDGNAGTARQLKRVLESRNLLCTEGRGSLKLETSGKPEIVIPQMQRLLHLGKIIAFMAKEDAAWN